MTLCAIIISIVFAFLTPHEMGFEVIHHSTTIFLVGGTVILSATIFLNTWMLLPLNNLEQSLVPNLLEMIRRDHLLHFGRLILYLFVLVSYVCVVLIPHIQRDYYQDWFFLGWLIFFGLAIDVFRDSWHRFLNYLNPPFLVSHLSREAIHAVQKDQNDLLFNALDSLAEVGVRSVEKSKLALSTQTLQAFPTIIQAFLASSKSIGHVSADLNKEKVVGGGDRASYTIFYLLQRLELINDKALRDRQETVCRQMIVSLGKIIIYCAQLDLSMVAFPTHFLTKFGLKAQQNFFDEVTVLTTSTLLEIAKTILSEIDVTYAELQDPFRAIINGLDAIAKGTFKKQKNTSIKVLVQPLVDLKALFNTEKMARHPDTPTINHEIDRVLEEFSVLEQVMQSIPPISDFGIPEGSTAT